MAANNYTKYDEDSKKPLVSLHQNGKTQAQLCKEYGVSQSALGKWGNQYIASPILHIHVDYSKRLGAYKIAYVLKHDYGISHQRRTSVPIDETITYSCPECPPTNLLFPADILNDAGYRNHLQQNFIQKAPNLVWASDITYIKAGGKWHYLCIVMDLYSRKVISWHISPNADVELVITTFRKAYEKQNASYGLMFHSDRGTQYTAFAFR